MLLTVLHDRYAGTGRWGKLLRHLAKSDGAYVFTALNTTVHGGSAGDYGIYLDVQGTGGADALLDGVMVDSLTTGAGVCVGGLSTDLKNIDATACKWGIKLTGSGSPTLQNSGGTENDLTGCTTGLFVNGSVTPDVDDVNITVPSGQVGLYTDNTSGGSYTGVMISGGQTGFMASSTAAHTLRSSSISGFSDFGVKVVSAGLVDLGTTANYGNNNIYESGATKYVSVKNRVYGLGDVMAEKCWWGADPPPSSMFSTSVDYSPALTQEVSFSSRHFEIARVPIRPTLAFHPNPFHLGGTLEFAVPAAGVVSLGLYDVAGRLVREFVTGSSSPGVYTIAWDGRNTQGTEVPVGVYFVEFKTDQKRMILKIVRVP